MSRRGLGQAEALKQPPRIFDPENLGRAFKEVAVDIIEVESGVITSRWYHGGPDADLLIWTDGTRAVIKHQVNVFGQVVEWNLLEGVKTGLILEEEAPALSSSHVAAESTGSGDAASEVIQFDDVAQSSAIHQAIRLVENISVLSEDDRQALCDQLRTGPRHRRALASSEARPGAGTRGEESIASPLAKLEPSVRKGRRAPRPGFWKRLRNWFKGHRD